ncbi:hypothetical protein GIB67_011811 [Kingdonia uniflora]|uniref:Uncharacterized protein n=1 Tax=Kingdonia uniflora TaxID=39325 RepID=A0A7J7NY98_9MAGN|nr:hypothetical protein GIB67_011811 [Kingdonia uniflora]
MASFDKDLDDAELWAVIDSAAASHSSSKPRKPLALKHITPQSHSPVSISSPFSTPKPSKTHCNHGEAVQEPWIKHRPQKIARSSGSCVVEENRMVVVKQEQRTSTTPTQMYSSPDCGRFMVQEISPSPMPGNSLMGFCQSEGKENTVRHSLFGQFPSVSLFKEYQNAAMAVYLKTNYCS